MGCCLPGSSVRGILQARILEWVAIPISTVVKNPATNIGDTGKKTLEKEMATQSSILPGKPHRQRNLAGSSDGWQRVGHMTQWLIMHATLYIYVHYMYIHIYYIYIMYRHIHMHLYICIYRLCVYIYVYKKM